jgi:hypothetical protein
MERATGIEPVLPAWESKLPLLYFHNLQKRSAKINVHARHTVHAVPDLRIAAGRLRDGFLSCVAVQDRRFEAYFFVPEASQRLRSVMTNYLRAKIPCQRSAKRPVKRVVRFFSAETNHCG